MASTGMHGEIDGKGIAILERAISAAGGREAWSGALTLEVDVRLGGVVWRSKGVALPSEPLRVVLDRVSGQVRMAIPSRPDVMGVAAADGVVWLEDSTGTVLEQRDSGRAAFPARRWDDLHYAYFAGYAMRNYLSAPFLLAEPGFSVRAAGTSRVSGRRTDRIEVVFPESVITHSRRQAFHIDDEGLILRHDYTAEVVGRWPGAAHLCADHTTFDGLRLATRRWVVPRIAGRPLPGPRLITLDIQECRAQRA